MNDTIRESEPRPFAFVEGRVIGLELSTSVYSSSAILRACYKFADRLYSFVSPTEDDAVAVALWSRGGGELSPSLLGEFCNELADQELRRQLAQETAYLRDMVVAQAFAEGDLSGELDEADYEADPLGIAATR
jgi:His-Xaa-Ser system protein HxsD